VSEGDSNPDLTLARHRRDPTCSVRDVTPCESAPQKVGRHCWVGSRRPHHSHHHPYGDARPRGLIIPTVLFVVAVFGEVYAERILDAILP